MSLLTHEEAARRVRKDFGTLKRWRRSGLRMTTDKSGRRVVDEALLLAWWRDWMQNDPAHQARLRGIAIANGWELPPQPVAREVLAIADEDATADEDDAEVSRWPPTPVEPFPRFRGADKCNALHAAMRHSAPACRGVDAFTADSVASHELARPAAICRSCPVFAECSAFAETARPDAGVWAGRVATRAGLRATAIR